MSPRTVSEILDKITSCKQKDFCKDSGMRFVEKYESKKKPVAWIVFEDKEIVPIYKEVLSDF